MARLIAIIGNSGSGKTTLTKALCRGEEYCELLEQHFERPFQSLFSVNRKGYACVNQIDYLLFRAEQELSLKDRYAMMVQDGGLDQDFHVFTKLFYHKGYLSRDEFELCERLYRFTREFLPLPDLYVLVGAPIKILRERREKRKRTLDIVTDDDLEQIDPLLEEWTHNLARLVLKIDSSMDDISYGRAIEYLRHSIDELTSRNKASPQPGIRRA